MEVLSRKVFLVLLKFLPFIISCCYLIGSILVFVEIPIYPGWIWGTSVITTLFMVVASHVFQFCFYHRVFIYYPITIEIVNRLILWFGISLSTRLSLVIVSVLFFAVCVIALINYLKHNEQVSIIKSCPTRHHR